MREKEFRKIVKEEIIVQKKSNFSVHKDNEERLKKDKFKEDVAQISIAS